MTIGQAIYQLRKEEGLTGRSLAELLGISCSTITMYEQGKRNPGLKRLQQIAKVTNRSLIIKIHPEALHAKFMFRESIVIKSFDEKIQDCWQPLFRYCMKYLCKNTHDAKDLVQDTMLAAYEINYKHDADKGMMTWLIDIAKKKSYNKKSKLVYIEDYIEHDKLTDQSEDLFKKYPDIWKYINRLPARRKKYYQMSLIGMSYKEIALEIGTTEKTVKTTMGQVKSQLKKMIENG